MYGELIIANEKTKKYEKTYGLFTRNFAKLLTHILNAYDNHERIQGIKDLDGNENPVLAKSNLWFPNAIYYSNALVSFSASTENKCSDYTGALALISEEEHEPSPQDYTLPSIKQIIPLTLISITPQENRTVLVISGSAITISYIVVRSAGIALELFKFNIGQEIRCNTFKTLIDVFKISPLEFNAGDTISITYKITLA